MTGAVEHPISILCVAFWTGLLNGFWEREHCMGIVGIHREVFSPSKCDTHLIIRPDVARLTERRPMPGKATVLDARFC